MEAVIRHAVGAATVVVAHQVAVASVDLEVAVEAVRVVVVAVSAPSARPKLRSRSL